MQTKRKKIGPGNSCYFIAELSHNHQGDGDIALELIRQAATAGANAVKFQKRNNKTLFLPDFYNAPYDNKNSFGQTYGQHREFLEPRLEWLTEANTLAHSLGLDFIMTVFDTESLHFCEKHLSVDVYKIQSADLSFDVLIKTVANTAKPYFVSTGASTLHEIKNAYALCTALHSPFCFMYAVSAYPTPPGKINLVRFSQLRHILSAESMGYSCHYPGIEPAVYARVLGSVAIEKHFTLNKDQKGPDHKLSLLPGEFKDLVQRANEVDMMIGMPLNSDHEIEYHQQDARAKMGKSPVALKDLSAGEKLMAEDISYLSPAKGMSPIEVNKFIGKPLVKCLKKGSYIQHENFQ